VSAYRFTPGDRVEPRAYQIRKHPSIRGRVGTVVTVDDTPGGHTHVLVKWDNLPDELSHPKAGLLFHKGSRPRARQAVAGGALREPIPWQSKENAMPKSKTGSDHIVDQRMVEVRRTQRANGTISYDGDTRVTVGGYRTGPTVRLVCISRVAGCASSRHGTAGRPGRTGPTSTWNLSSDSPRRVVLLSPDPAASLNRSRVAGSCTRLLSG
jgi:hypothetical protein